MIITDQELAREEFATSVSKDNIPVYQVEPMSMTDFNSVMAYAPVYYGFKFHSNRGFSKAMMEQIRNELGQYDNVGYGGIVLNILVPKGTFPCMKNISRVLHSLYPEDKSFNPWPVWSITSTDALVRRQVEVVGAFTLANQATPNDEQ